MKISAYDNYFLSGKHGWLQSFTMYVQLIGVIMYMCTRKVIGSHRSLLTLFHVNVFAIECIHSRQSSWGCFKTVIELTGFLMLIRFNIIYLNPRGLLSAIVLLVSMKQALQNIDDALHDCYVFGTFYAQIYIYVRVIIALTIIIPRTLWSLENENEGPSFFPALKTVSFSSITIEEDLSSK